MINLQTKYQQLFMSITKNTMAKYKKQVILETEEEYKEVTLFLTEEEYGIFKNSVIVQSYWGYYVSGFKDLEEAKKWLKKEGKSGSHIVKPEKVLQDIIQQVVGLMECVESQQRLLKFIGVASEVFDEK